MPKYRLLPAGDTALVVEFEGDLSPEVSALVLALADRLAKDKPDGLKEAIPAFRSLLVQFEPLVLSSASLSARISELMRDLQAAERVGARWRIPVCYDASLAPDLAEVAARTGFSPAQVIERHSAVSYYVYMLGFLPGQAYMGDVSLELALPRRASPRTKVPAGSLAIANRMTCIFPLETPCGWHVIGRSPVTLWDRSCGGRALLCAGDRVSFSPVSLREYERLAAQAAAGLLAIAGAAA
jgi:inhibitor of KinA